MFKSFAILIFLYFSMNLNAQYHYPPTPKNPVKTEYFGTEVTDDYQWLEDDLSPMTEQWVKRQNQFTSINLSKIPYRAQIEKELTQMLDYEKVSMPFDIAGTTYFYKNDGLQKQSILYRKTKDGEELVIDPNTFSKDGTTSMSAVSFTKDGSLMAFLVSEGGADWKDIRILDTKTLQLLPDVIKNVKFSSVSWKGNSTFFYSTYPNVKGSELSAKTNDHRVFKHELGTSPSKDKMVFGNSDNPRRYVQTTVSEDQNYLIIEAANATSGNELYVVDFNEPEWKPVEIQGDFEANTHYFFNKGKMFYLVTDRDAPNRKIVKLDLNLKRTPENWTNFIPENPKSVMNPSYVGDKIIISYMVNANDEVIVYGEDGSMLYPLELPGEGSVSGFGGDSESKTTYFSFENYITPSTIFKYDLSKNESEVYSTSKINFDSNAYVTEQVMYSSFDGTEIPMTISYKKGTRMNGKNPTILYGYGGFNISLQPYFSAIVGYWLSKGGVYAVPNIRGGGEFGEEWHKAGTQLQKKNVFNDFIAAAQFLKNNGYTSTQYLALKGGSNGGLLVGATMTMQPQLAGVALPAVGVLDMLKYHQFTSGAGWAYDYGTSEDSKEMFDYLYSYSPVHNVKAPTCYPATLITTGDHDDRVVPAHSFKFAAELQNAQTCNNPIFIRVETSAGHGAGKSLETIIKENTDVFAFTFYNMGITELP